MRAISLALGQQQVDVPEDGSGCQRGKADETIKATSNHHHRGVVLRWSRQNGIFT